MGITAGRFLRLGASSPPWKFAFQAKVNLEHFAPNRRDDYKDISLDDDVGVYPDVVEGPVAPPLGPQEADVLLAKELVPPLVASDRTSSKLCSDATTAHPPSKDEAPAKKLSKAAQEREERRRQRKRAKRREREIEVQYEIGTSLKAVSRRRATAAKCVAASTASLADYRHSPSGYSGYPNKKGRAPVSKELSNLLEAGFDYIDWDGREGIYILDQCDRVIVCGGSPNDDGWQGVAVDAANAIKEARGRCGFIGKDETHRRGRFPAMARGISFGNGLRIPSNVRPSTENRRDAMDFLIKHHSIQRIAGFQSCLLDAYAPNVGKYFRENLDALIMKDPRLEKNFKNSAFAAITVNFGPRTVSIPHVDHANLATGMCALTALGDFDPDEGGHLVLWDLRTIIRFPPGSTLLFPSALIKHSNIPIQVHEQRYSVTQYSSGGLFRWVENGFCCDKDSVIPVGPQRMAWDAGIQRLQVRPIDEPEPLDKHMDE